jgi:hypothetical protein
MVMSPVGIGTKSNCAGEDQQQFSIQSVSQSEFCSTRADNSRVLRQKTTIMGPACPEIKNESPKSSPLLVSLPWHCNEEVRMHGNDLKKTSTIRKKRNKQRERSGRGSSA